MIVPEYFFQKMKQKRTSYEFGGCYMFLIILLDAAEKTQMTVHDNGHGKNQVCIMFIYYLFTLISGRLPIFIFSKIHQASKLWYFLPEYFLFKFSHAKVMQYFMSPSNFVASRDNFEWTDSGSNSE